MLYYKLQNNLCDSSISNLFKPGKAVTRGNGFKLTKLSGNLDINKYCYHNRVVVYSNGLGSDSTVNCIRRYATESMRVYPL